LGFDLLDIDFLMSERSSLKSCVVYEYNIGIFKQDVLSRISSIFESKNIDFQEVDYYNFNMSSRSSSLFGESAFLIDLNKLVQKEPNCKKCFNELVTDISSKKIYNRYIFCVRSGFGISNIQETDQYKKLKEISYNIVELELSKSTVAGLINFLINKNKGLYYKVKNLEEFKKVLSSNTRSFDLLNFIKFFGRISYFCIEDNFFSIDNFNRITKIDNDDTSDDNILCKNIVDFMVEGSHRSKDKLFNTVFNLYFNKKYSTKLILYRIIKVVRELSFINKRLGVSEGFLATLTKQKKYFLEKFDSVPVKDLVRFSSMLVKYEEKLNTGNFIFEFNQFLIALMK
jgi:hypothetical protein